MDRKEYRRNYSFNYSRSEWGKRKILERNTRIAIAVQEIRSKLITSMGSKCQRCGFGDSRCFQFHHIEGGGCKIRREKYKANKERKLNQSSRVRYYSDLLIEVESGNNGLLMVCANCHIIVHDEMKRESRSGIHHKLIQSSFGEIDEEL